MEPLFQYTAVEAFSLILLLIIEQMLVYGKTKNRTKITATSRNQIYLNRLNGTLCKNNTST